MTRDCATSSANTEPNTRLTANWRGREGVTLIELVVAIVVLGILTSVAAVNWSSFVKNQELRQEAIGLHREILAQRASALDHGDDIRIVHTATSYAIQKRADPTINTWTTSRTVNLKGNMSIIIPTLPSTETFQPAVTVPNPNAWGGAARTIVISPNNLNAFTNGWIVLTNGKKQYCIIKEANNVRPELYYRNGTSGTWNKN